MTAGAAHKRPDTSVRHRRSVTSLCPPMLLGVAIALAVAWVRCAPPMRGAPADAVYTVAYLSAQLAAHPAPWIGLAAPAAPAAGLQLRPAGRRAGRGQALSA